MAARILLNLLASTLFLALQFARPQSRTENAGSTTPPVIQWHAAGAITIPFEYFRQHIYINVSINGRPGYIFMLDSGANRNILNLRTARQLGMKVENLEPASHIGVGQGLIYAGPQEYVDVKIGTVPVADAVAVLDLNPFEQHFHHPTDGMLGYPFFRRFVVKLDFEKRLLTLTDPTKYRYRGLGMELRLRPSRNFIEMPVTVVSGRYISHDIHVVVDTGSNVTLILYERFVRPLGLETSFQRSHAAKAFGLNGYYPVQLANIDSLQMGNAETRNLQMEYLQDEDEVGTERTLPGAIGNGILQSFREVIFDVPHRRMFLEIHPAPWRPAVQQSETVTPY